MAYHIADYNAADKTDYQHKIEYSVDKNGNITFITRYHNYDPAQS